MPTEREAARSWLDEREATDRKNGRVCDKLMVALPIELDGAQRADLVREFMEEFGAGRVSWLAGIHDRGEDAHNPHAHILIRDKDHETGKRVFGTSEKGSTGRLREMWERVANRALEREGIDARIDRRSLAEQGLAREPGIHVGPNVHAMEERGLRPESIAQDHTTSRGNERVVNWPEIDHGRTRADRQREIEAMNADLERGGSGKGTGRGEAATLEPEPLHQLDQDGPPEDRWGPSPEYEDQGTWEPDHQADAEKTATKPKQPEPEKPREDLRTKNQPARDEASPDPEPRPKPADRGHRHNAHVHGTHREALDAYEALRRTDPVTAARLFGDRQGTAPDREADREAVRVKLAELRAEAVGLDAARREPGGAWTAQAEGWDKLNSLQQLTAFSAYSEWIDKRDPKDTREAFTVQEYVTYVQDREAAKRSSRTEQQAQDATQDAYRRAKGERVQTTPARKPEAHQAAQEAAQRAYGAAKGNREGIRPDPAPQPAKAPENTPRDPHADRLAWATMLRGLDSASRVQDATQQGYRAAQGQRESVRAEWKPEPADCQQAREDAPQQTSSTGNARPSEPVRQTPTQTAGKVPQAPSKADDIKEVLGNLSASERAVWEQIKAEREAGADAERLADLEGRAAGIEKARKTIKRQEYESGSFGERPSRDRDRGREL